MNIFHNSQLEDCRKPFGAVETGTSVHLQIECQGAQNAQLRLWEDAEGETMIPMIMHEDWAEIDVQTPDHPTVLWYFFVLTYPDKTICYGNNRKRLGGIGEIYENEEPQSYQISVYENFEVPQWYKNSIAYQIFPDRFCKGKLENAPDIKLEDWSTLPYYHKDEDGRVTEWNFWGGNLQGIIDKLDYLKDLKISCIYLNPIFKAASNHRYDTADYLTIDPLLGDEKLFRTLCREARKRGIRIILDGVFSHTGIHSAYYEEHPDWYTGGFWWGVKDLPEVNENHPEFKEFICGEDGVLRKWLRLGASGWRLDVADELPDEFIEAVRECIKDENPDAVLIGEVWEDASSKISYGHRRTFLGGRQLDAPMNYPLRKDILDFIYGNIDAYEFAARARCREENYPKESLYGCFNLIDSHDRRRILSAVSGDKEKMQIAVVLSFALPGVPVIYYGDEAGLEGMTDPDNRRTFPWGSEAADIMDFYKGLTSFYTAHESLKSGQCGIFAFSPEDLVIERRSGDDKIEIHINKKTLTCAIIDRSKRM